MPIGEEDRDNTSFVTHRGAFRWIRRTFVLRNAPATFPRILDLILSEVRLKTCLVYLDDVLIFSHNLKDHIKHADEVLALFGNAVVSLKIRKCQFFLKTLDYISHVLLPGRIAIAKDATSSLADAKFPEDITQLCYFLGECNVYRHFIKDFSAMAQPLNRGLRKDVKSTWHEPPDEQRHASEDIKLSLVVPPVLELPMTTDPSFSTRTPQDTKSA